MSLKKKLKRESGNAMSARISIRPADQSVVDTLSEAFGLPRFVSTVMAARGIEGVEAAKAFLEPSLERDWRDPYEISSMDLLVEALSSAVLDHKKVLVFGDFDLDGISATTIMSRGLAALGVSVVPFVPLRFEEGYGLTEAAITRALAYDPDVLITVDNGIAAKEEVERLKQAGVEVLITDHHEPANLVPEGVPVVDPKCDGCPSSILAGAGVALKVIQALGSRFGQPNLWLSLVDLAALGTVADLMPLVDENRALVARGIEMLNAEPRPCIAALIGASGQAGKQLTASNLSFSLVPRLNAAGRMGNAQLALDLLMEDDFVRASELAEELEKTNTQRRAIEAELAKVALEQAERVHEGRRCVVVAGEGWHEGVKGIVASRICGKYGIPSILFTIEGDEARGSGRSVGDVNLFEAVRSCEDLLTRFGGHEAAVGVTLPTANLQVFADRLNEYMLSLPEEDFMPKVEVDALVDFSELDLETVGQLDRLAPFGQENPVPRFLAHGVSIAQGRAVGAEKNHLSCTLSDGSYSLNCIMFHCGDIDSILACPSVVNAVFQLQIDEWRGRRSVKAVLSEIEPVAPCGALKACLVDEDVSFVDALVDAGEKTRAGAGFVKGPAAEVKSDEERKREWREIALGDPHLLEEALVQAFLGEGTLHPSQIETLSALSRGSSVVSVMGTGRGKSLIFQIHAIKLALSEGKASLLVYPLRALASDQAFHLVRVLEPFGLCAEVLNGETDAADRIRIFGGLAAGSVDLVLTTPEFLDAHVSEFADTGRVGFVVIDEAHHVATSKAGFRPSYRRLSEILDSLGRPQVLATTATADAEVLEALRTDTGIEDLVTDEHVRENLRVDDHRNIRQRERYLANIVVQGEKTIVYVNSRAESIALVRDLRNRVPQMAPLIGFYNAGLTRDERLRIEDLFRNDELQVLVATSAFGEGVDVAGVRHVVLYHLPFSEIEFNQMSGRAGRDGNLATVHLLFGRSDGATNERILSLVAPDRDVMAKVYRELRRRQRESAADFFETTCQELSDTLCSVFPGLAVDAAQVSSGLSVFSELGLLELDALPSDATETCRLHVVDYGGKVNLTDSVRYREGLDEIDSFQDFKAWVLKRSVKVLEQRIRRPLLP